ncbi:MAG: type IV toxin-antitoxin system AbiEi family antitoxin [Armatimonadetes bacterium]|nr:type IV toxin-antitoxin system AbiEi family antitoxin [Armatimonadota bacterium]
MKAFTETELIAHGRKALAESLDGVPFVCLDSAASDPQPAEADMEIRIRLPERERTLLLALRSSGQPRNVRIAVAQINRWLLQRPEAYGVFVAPYLSPAAVDICRNERIGCLDFAGNVLLTFDHVYIERTGKLNPFAVKRDLQTLYAPRAERVLRTLLNSPRTEWQVQRLAKEAKVSLGLASNVKKLLDQREWLRKATSGSGFTLVAPEELLQEWVENWRPKRNQIQAFYSLKSVSDNEYGLGQVCRQQGASCALTGLSGAARYAPYVRYQKMSAYVVGDVRGIVAHLGWKPVSSGANIHLITPYDEGVFYASEERGGVQTVSSVQVYLDMQQEKGRGEEAAAYLLEEVIRPTW